MNLKQLVKGVLENKDCCTATKPTKAPILNESLAPREILSEGLRYHIDNKKPLTEHVYRAGSSNYFNLWAEAKSLYVRGILDFSGDDLEILTETDLGHFGIYEGQKVPLDFIMEEEEPVEEIKLTGAGVMDMVRRVSKDAKLLDFLNFNTFRDFLIFIKTGSLDDYYEVENDIKQYDQQLTEGLDEAKSKPKKKNPPIGKPKRGGAKKFYVYVRDKGKIKKVSFGAQGMSAKINNSKARAAFSKRHNCPQKKDKTKASYWSCRLPRYAKLLGLKSSFSGFW
jgi:hypothetical protein